MQLAHLIEGRFISQSEARVILQEIETGRGRIAEIVQRKPYLREMSQQAVAEQHGKQFQVFRSVAVDQELRPDGVASVTPDFMVAFNMARNVPVMFTPKGVETRDPHLVSYKIDLERVIGYAPALVGHAMEILKGKIRTIQDRHGDRLSVDVIVDTAQGEKEIIADLSGLQPKVLRIGQTVNDSIWSAMLRDIYMGRYKNPDQYMKQIKQDNPSWIPDGYLEDRERAMEQFRQTVAQKAEEMKAFLSK